MTFLKIFYNNRKIVNTMKDTCMNDTIFLDEITEFPPTEKSSKKGFIKHVQCEGARFHVVHFDTLGSHCSEERCVLNEKYSHKNKKE